MRPLFLRGLLRISLTFSSILGLLGILGWLFPLHHPHLNARRSACQSNLRQIGLALQQYAQDYDDRLPPRGWKAPLRDYTKDEGLFQCPGPATEVKMGSADYFWNARFIGKSLEKIGSPRTLILMGDGQDNGADATLFSIPAAWRSDKNSPAWRHLDTGNYLFADGHVKALKVSRVDRDFRMVTQ